MIDIIIGTVIVLAWNGYLYTGGVKRVKMDRLDYDLRDYYAQEEETCPNCGSVY